MKGHGLKADIWSLGILLFELLHGHSPFRSMGPIEIIEKLKSWKEPKITTVVSREAASLLINLLKKEPQERVTLREAMNSNFVMRNSSIYKTRESTFKEEVGTVSRENWKFMKKDSGGTNTTSSSIESSIETPTTSLNINKIIDLNVYNYKYASETDRNRNSREKDSFRNAIDVYRDSRDVDIDGRPNIYKSKDVNASIHENSDHESIKNIEKREKIEKGFENYKSHFKGFGTSNQFYEKKENNSQARINYLGFSSKTEIRNTEKDISPEETRKNFGERDSRFQRDHERRR